MTKEYIFTLVIDEEDKIWKCVVSDDKCVTYEGDTLCQTFDLTTSERAPHVLQLDTVAKVYEEELPLQVENGMPFLKLGGKWEASDTTDEDRLQATVSKYKRESVYYGIIGIVLILVQVIDQHTIGYLTDVPMFIMLGIFCIFTGASNLVRVKNELEAMGRKMDWKLHRSDFKKM